jgi:uncharacterized protein YejL (UPF0352 family)
MPDAPVTAILMGVTFPVTPTTARVSKGVSVALTRFVRGHGATPDDLRVTTEDMANFLIEQAHAVAAAQHYLDPMPALAVFQDDVLFRDIAEFWQKQVQVNGPQDFLLQPMGSLVTNLIAANVSVDRAIADSFRQFMVDKT